MANDRPRFIYDGDCGFCSWVVDRLSRGARGHRIDWMMAQSLEELPAGLTSTDVENAAWYVTNERAHGGFAAFRRLSLVLPVLWLVAPLLWVPGMGLVGNVIYRGIASRRRAISIRLGLAACSLRRLPPARERNS